MSRILGLVAVTLGLATTTAPASAADLVGSSVTGSITANPARGFSVTTQFSSPAVVGSGLEFTGLIYDGSFSQDYTITSDFSATSLVLHVTSSKAFANTSGSALFTLDFGSASNAFPSIVSSTHTCDANAANSVCPGRTTYVPTVTSSSSAIRLVFDAVAASDIYTLTFAPAATNLPEPASWTMMILGMGAVGYTMRRRRVTMFTSRAG